MKLENPEKASSLTNEVASCLTDMENNPDCAVSGELKHVQLCKAVEVTVGSGRKVIVVVFPLRTYNDFIRKNVSKFVAEMEKKLRRPVLLVAKRSPVPRERPDLIGMKRRPYSRSLTFCREALLSDMVAPSEIVGKRLHMKTDGSRILKVFLDPRCREVLGDKLEAFSAAYRKLAKTDAVFSFGESL